MNVTQQNPQANFPQGMPQVIQPRSMLISTPTHQHHHIAFWFIGFFLGIILGAAAGYYVGDQYFFQKERDAFQLERDAMNQTLQTLDQRLQSLEEVIKSLQSAEIPTPSDTTINENANVQPVNDTSNTEESETSDDTPTTP